MIHFFQEDIPFTVPRALKVKRWIAEVLRLANANPGEINFIFCSDLYLHSLNMQYLNHDTYTDIITFEHSEEGEIAGDIFISIDRVNENALLHSIPIEDELHRVMIHGILHLLGFSDKTPKEKALMREKEDACLSLRSELT